MAQADGTNPGLRVSDAERDAVANELGQHFQDGRLDKAEFDERVTAAMNAKTERDLDQVLTDLPQAAAREPRRATGRPGQEGTPQATPWRSAPTRGRPRILLALLVAAVVITGLPSGSWHHVWSFAPFGLLWLIVPILACRTRLMRARRRQWR